MGNEGSYAALGLKVWKAQIERADKLFGGLSAAEVLRAVTPQSHVVLPVLHLDEFTVTTHSGAVYVFRYWGGACADLSSPSP